MVLDYWRVLEKIFLALAVSHTFLVCGAQKLEYPSDKEGNTTTRGIVEYIEDKDSLINKQFDETFDVNSYDVDFVPDAMSKYSDDTSHQGFYLRNGGGRRYKDFINKSSPKKRRNHQPLKILSETGTL